MDSEAREKRNLLGPYGDWINQLETVLEFKLNNLLNSGNYMPATVLCRIIVGVFDSDYQGETGIVNRGTGGFGSTGSH